MLDMRASLLSTTIFYDHMLKQHGARSLDWVGKDLARITTVAQLARWYTDNFGLRVLVRDGDEWKQVVRLMDFGPAAWRTVAAVIPDLPFKPGVHVHYQETVLPIRDGVLKLKDVPKEMGGSGVNVAE